MHRGFDLLVQGYPLRPVILLVTHIGDGNISHEKEREQNPWNDPGNEQPTNRRVRERAVDQQIYTRWYQYPQGSAGGKRTQRLALWIISLVQGRERHCADRCGRGDG